MTNKIGGYTALTEEQIRKYASIDNSNFKLPENIGNLNKTSKTGVEVQNTEENVSNILEKLPEINLEKENSSVLKKEFKKLFLNYGEKGMRVYYGRGEDYIDILDGLDDKVFTPIRDIFTKENIENILNRIGEMSKNKTLSKEEENIKTFFENINIFFENYKEKISYIKKQYKGKKIYTDEDTNNDFTNDINKFIKFIQEATKKYDIIVKVLNREVKVNKTEKLNPETESTSTLFKKLIGSILNKFKK